MWRRLATCHTTSTRGGEGGGTGKGGIHTACTVKQAIASFDGIVDLVGAGVVVDLPATEADEGHVVATVEFDRWR